jgi:phospholipid transport system substrate-binding protein
VKNLLLALALWWLPSSAVLASAAPAEKRLITAVDQVVAAADRSSNTSDLARNVRPILEKHLDFGAMTRRAIGPGWRQFSEAQRAEATKLFTTLIIRTYSEKFTIGERPQVDYKPAVETAAGRVEVPTTLLYKGSRYEVVYRMEQAGNWLITDIVVEGVSFVANYRTQFDAQFKRGGPDAVLASLRDAVSKFQ